MLVYFFLLTLYTNATSFDYDFKHLLLMFVRFQNPRICVYLCLDNVLMNLCKVTAWKIRGGSVLICLRFQFLHSLLFPLKHALNKAVSLTHANETTQQ